MQFSHTFLALLASQIASAALNEPCYGANGAHGVCVSTATCSGSGGTTINGGCPSDAADVKCCSKPTCSTGNCRWNSDCAGSSASGQCPGPSAFQCCNSGAAGFGGYGAPAIPSGGGCQAVATEAARRTVAAFPGRIREIFCTRGCACNANPTSDHCCGKAQDYMCSDGGGRATLSGLAIAEWTMNNRAALNVKYIIWGQKIWSPSRDAVKPWSQWRTMEDRGSITQNHWDHVHVSYN